MSADAGKKGEEPLPVERRGYLLNEYTGSREYFVLRGGVLRIRQSPRGADSGSVFLAHGSSVTLLANNVLEVRSRVPYVQEYILAATSEHEAEGWHDAIQASIQAEQSKCDKLTQLLETGCTMHKYNYSNSKRSRRYFWVSSTSGGCELCWGRSKGEDTQKVSLTECIGIIYGPMTTTFQRCPTLEDASWSCFSLLFMGRTVDLAVVGDLQVRAWFLGMQHLISRHGIGSMPMMSDAQFIARKVQLKLTDAAHAKGLVLGRFLLESVRALASGKGLAVAETHAAELQEYDDDDEVIEISITKQDAIGPRKDTDIKIPVKDGLLTFKGAKCKWCEDPPNENGIRLAKMSLRELKEELVSIGLDPAGCIERSDFEKRLLGAPAPDAGAKAKASEVLDKRRAEADRKRAEEERQRKEEEEEERAREAKKKADAAEKKIAEEDRLRAETRDEEERLWNEKRAEEDRQRAEKRAEEDRQRAEEDERRRAEFEDKRSVEEESKQREADELKRQREELAEDMKKQEEELLRKREEFLAKAEEMARAEEDLRTQQEELERKREEEKKLLEEERQRVEEERRQAEEGRLKAEEEDRKRTEEARQQLDEARQQLSEEDQKRADERRLQDEENAQKRAEEDKQRAEEEERRRADADAQRAEELAKKEKEVEEMKQQQEELQRKADELAKTEELMKNQREELERQNVDADKARQQAEEEAQKAKEERQSIEEERQRVEEERQRAEQEGQQAKEERQRNEEARQSAEEERQRVEEERRLFGEETQKKTEADVVRAEEERQRAEEEARERAEENRLRAEQEAQKRADDQLNQAENFSSNQKTVDEMKLAEQDLLRRAQQLADQEERLNRERAELLRGRANLAVVQAGVMNMLEPSATGGEMQTHCFEDSDDEGANDGDDDAYGDDMDWSAIVAPTLPAEGEDSPKHAN